VGSNPTVPTNYMKILDNETVYFETLEEHLGYLGYLKFLNIPFGGPDGEDGWKQRLQMFYYPKTFGISKKDIQAICEYLKIISSS
jgi:hypothetical protein